MHRLRLSPRTMKHLLLLLTLGCTPLSAAPPTVFTNGKIVTVDDAFTVTDAMAVDGERIVALGDKAKAIALAKLAGGNAKLVDLGGRMVLPGLMDSHVHPTGAAMTEFDHEIPQMDTIRDVLGYIAARAKAVPEGSWISVRQVFITRLKEQRYPTREELDRAAPKNPVHFSTGPDSMLNTLALKLSGITRDFRPDDGGTGKVELDPKTGEPTGLLRGLSRFVKMKTNVRTATQAESDARLAELFRDYNAVGLTAVCDRDSSPAAIAAYQRLKDKGALTVRMRVSHGIPVNGQWRTLEHAIEEVAEHPARKNGDDMLRIIGTKVYLDGGMLTGSAYMREPWGVSKIYGITDPAYRGNLMIAHDRLVQLVTKVTGLGLQFTAHSVGDGAVHELLDVYEELSKHREYPRGIFNITHSNFMGAEDVRRAAKLGVTLDIQPVWLFLDSWTLLKQFGQERTQWFQPLRSIFEAGGLVGGGSDHMQKIGSMRSVNPYNPWLGIRTAITRQARFVDAPVHPEQALTREQALRLYTINNAKLLFLEKECGSLEPGKRADFIIIDRDVLHCPAGEIADTKVIETWLDGKPVWTAGAGKQ
jgi:predicted amidohydrolase YtcJ